MKKYKFQFSFGQGDDYFAGIICRWFIDSMLGFSITEIIYLLVNGEIVFFIGLNC